MGEDYKDFAICLLTDAGKTGIGVFLVLPRTLAGHSDGFNGNCEV